MKHSVSFCLPRTMERGACGLRFVFRASEVVELLKTEKFSASAVNIVGSFVPSEI